MEVVHNCLEVVEADLVVGEVEVGLMMDLQVGEVDLLELEVLQVDLLELEVLEDDLLELEV